MEGVPQFEPIGRVAERLPLGPSDSLEVAGDVRALCSRGYGTRRLGRFREAYGRGDCSRARLFAATENSHRMGTAIGVISGAWAWPKGTVSCTEASSSVVALSGEVAL